MTTHCHLLSVYDVQDLSAELTRLISLHPHNIPEGSIAIRKLKFRWEGHTATAAQLRSTDWGWGCLGLAFCAGACAGLEPEVGMGQILSVSLAMRALSVWAVSGCTLLSLPPAPLPTCRESL